MRNALSILLIAAIWMLSLVPPALAEDHPHLWLYYSTNLVVDKNIDDLERIWRRAAAAGYSHVLLADSKFARLGDLGDSTRHYMANVGRVKKLAEQLKLQIVPAV